MQEEGLIGESPSGEIELDMDTLPPSTLRRMQRIVDEKLGRAPVGGAGRASVGGGGGRGGGRGGKTPADNRERVGRAAAVAQERAGGGAGIAPPPGGRTIFDDGE